MIQAKEKEEQLTSLGKYKIIKQLGSGSQGCVYLGQNKQQEEFAIKLLQKAQSPKEQEKLEQEIQILKSINNKNVVKLIDMFQSNNGPCLVLEYCKDGSLSHLIKKSSGQCLKEDQAMNIFVQIMQGLQSIHALSTVHRDIKCINIVMHEGVPKIADFGLAKKLNLDQDLMTKSKCGTPPYEAPEILQGKPYGFKVDIWALGVVLFNMLFGVYPFGNHTDMKKQLEQIKNICTPEFDLQMALNGKNDASPISPEVEHLFKRIFQICQHKRIDFQELYKHPATQKYIKNLTTQVEFTQTIEFYKQKKFNMLASIERQTGEGNGEEFKDKICLQDKNQNFIIKELEDQIKCQEEDDAMISEILYYKNKPTNDKQSKFHSYIKRYCQFLNPIYILNDTLENFKDNKTVMNILDEFKFLILQSYIIKMIIFWLKSFQVIIESNENIFDFQSDWADFIFSKSFNGLKIQVATRIEHFQSHLKLLIQDLLKSDYFSNKEFVIALESDIKCEFNLTYNKNIPSDLKIYYRAVLMTCFQLFQKVGNEALSDDKYAQQIRKKQHLQYLRLMLRLLFCVGFSRIFRIDSTKINLDCLNHIQKNRVKSLLELINKADVKQAQIIIDEIMSKYFTNLQKKEFKFMN